MIPIINYELMLPVQGFYSLYVRRCIMWYRDASNMVSSLQDHSDIYQEYLDTETFGPFYQHCLTLIPARISNYTIYKVWGEITYPFSNLNGCTVEVWEWIINLIPHFTWYVITYPCLDLSSSMLVKEDPDLITVRFYPRTFDRFMRNMCGRHPPLTDPSCVRTHPKLDLWFLSNWWWLEGSQYLFPVR